MDPAQAMYRHVPVFQAVIYLPVSIQCTHSNLSGTCKVPRERNATENEPDEGEHREYPVGGWIRHDDLGLLLAVGECNTGIIRRCNRLEEKRSAFLQV